VAAPARHAGVSMMTVSRLMNSSSNVRIDDFRASREMTE
jgi:DNA-binding LacI/PurR family transcriptional regulator